MGYREQLDECTDPVSGDWLEITNTSAGSTNKDQKVDVGRFAILANAGTFTTTQNFSPSSTSANGVNVNMLSGTTAAALTIYHNSNLSFNFIAQTAQRAMQINSFSNGSSVGPNIQIGYNNHSTTPAAGHLLIYNRGGTYYSIWPDASGNLRIVSGSQPTSATDTSGTVVGTQTSYAALKEDVAPWDGAGALDAILTLPLHSYRFKSDEGQRQYHGIVINDEDRGAWYSENDADNQTPVLNERNLFGYLIAAIQEQQRQIEELKARVNQ